MAGPAPYPWPRFTFSIAETRVRDPSTAFTHPSGLWLPPKDQHTNIQEQQSVKYFRCNSDRIFRLLGPLPPLPEPHSAYTVYTYGYRFCIVNHDATDMPVGDGRWRRSDPRQVSSPMTFDWRFLKFLPSDTGFSATTSMFGEPERVPFVRPDQQMLLNHLLPQNYHGRPATMRQQGQIFSDLALFLAIVAHSVPSNRTQRQFELGYVAGLWTVQAEPSYWPDMRGILVKIYADDKQSGDAITAYQQQCAVIR